MAEKSIESLSNKIMFGRLCEEAQRKNPADEEGDQQEKLTMFDKVYNEDLNCCQNVENQKIEIKNIEFQYVEKNPFVQQNQLNLEKYGKCLYFDELQNVLEENVLLVCQETYNYLCNWSIIMAHDDEYIGMARVCNQALIIQFILNLVKDDNKKNSNKCIKTFFERILTDENYQEEFREQLPNMYTFSTLPIELVYRILDHLSGFTLFCSMQNVCQRFNQILNIYHRYE
ncbi:hypothetical protein I4U23_021784, partial [Adineta vaga]